MSAVSTIPTPLRVLQAWLGALALIVAHFGLRPLVSGRVELDFALIAVLFAAVRMRPGFAALTGFVVGICLDAMSPGSFGTEALALTLLGYATPWLRAVFFSEHVGLTAMLVFASKWLLDAALLLLTGTSSAGGVMSTLLIWSPLSAALTSVVAVILLTLFRPLFRPAAR